MSKKKKPLCNLFVEFDHPPTKEREVEHTLMRGNKVIKKWRTTPKKTTKAVDTIQKQVIRLFDNPDSDSVYKLKVVALFPRPVRLLKKNVTSNLLVGKVPDWDNIGKVVSDAFNKIIWKDDAQVAHSIVVKRFVKMKNGIWETPGIKIKVWELGKKW